MRRPNPLLVIPAQAGIQRTASAVQENPFEWIYRAHGALDWIPACAGMTREKGNDGVKGGPCEVYNSYCNGRLKNRKHYFFPEKNAQITSAVLMSRLDLPWNMDAMGALTPGIICPPPSML